MKRQTISPTAQRIKELNQRADDFGVSADKRVQLTATARRRRDFQYDREMREINGAR